MSNPVAAMIVDKRGDGMALLWREALEDDKAGDYDALRPANAPHSTVPLFRAPSVSADLINVLLSEHAIVENGALINAAYLAVKIADALEAQ